LLSGFRRKSMKTKITEILGIEFPIIQGGMAWVADGKLAAAVSEAGGLGIIGAGNAPPDHVRNQIRLARELTKKPIGVNVYYMSPFVDQVVDVIVEKGVEVITTGAGNPGKHIGKLKEANVKIFPVVSSVALAKRLERLGVDGVIAEGMECGGHIGELTTFALVPQVVDAVGIPVIAAGGIADGRGFLAAIALGAEGVQIGTRFVCSNECSVHENYKNILVNAKDRDTTITGQSTGHPVRILKNKLSKKFEEMEKEGAPIEELEKLGSGKLRAAVVDGDTTWGSVMTGQICGMIGDIKPCKNIILDIINEAKNTLKLMGESKWEK
jgi:enoyl-[acyl-carrier protein] reductase II